MLLQTNSYIVPKEKRVDHSRLLRKFRHVLARIGCDHFETYEQVGANWNSGDPTGRYVQILRFRDRRHQQRVQQAERTDPGAQQVIAEFCNLINLPYQQQQGMFAVGFYTSVLPVATPRGKGQAAEEFEELQDQLVDPFAGGTSAEATSAAFGGLTGGIVAPAADESAQESEAETPDWLEEPPTPAPARPLPPKAAKAAPAPAELEAFEEETLADEEPATIGLTIPPLVPTPAAKAPPAAPPARPIAAPAVVPAAKMQPKTAPAPVAPFVAAPVAPAPRVKPVAAPAVKAPIAPAVKAPIAPAVAVPAIVAPPAPVVAPAPVPAVVAPIPAPAAVVPLVAPPPPVVAETDSFDDLLADEFGVAEEADAVEELATVDEVSTVADDHSIELPADLVESIAAGDAVEEIAADPVAELATVHEKEPIEIAEHALAEEPLVPADLEFEEPAAAELVESSVDLHELSDHDLAEVIAEPAVVEAIEAASEPVVSEPHAPADEVTAVVADAEPVELAEWESAAPAVEPEAAVTAVVSHDEPVVAPVPVEAHEPAILHEEPAIAVNAVAAPIEEALPEAVEEATAVADENLAATGEWPAQIEEAPAAAEAPVEHEAPLPIEESISLDEMSAMLAPESHEHEVQAVVAHEPLVVEESLDFAPTAAEEISHQPDLISLDEPADAPVAMQPLDVPPVRADEQETLPPVDEIRLDDELQHEQHGHEPVTAADSALDVIGTIELAEEPVRPAPPPMPKPTAMPAPVAARPPMPPMPKPPPAPAPVVNEDSFGGINLIEPEPALHDLPDAMPLEELPISFPEQQSPTARPAALVRNEGGMRKRVEVFTDDDINAGLNDALKALDGFDATPAPKAKRRSTTSTRR